VFLVEIYFHDETTPNLSATAKAISRDPQKIARGLLSYRRHADTAGTDGAPDAKAFSRRCGRHPR
jgi:hypothetical protein